MTEAPDKTPALSRRDRIALWWELRSFYKQLPQRLQLSHQMRLLVVPDERSLRPMPETRKEVQSWVKRLTDSGAVDEGCGDVLDELVDAWHLQQQHEIEKKYLSRKTMIQELLLQVQDRRAAAQAPYRMLLARRRTNVQALRNANERLLGTPFVDDDETFGWTEPPTGPRREHCGEGEAGKPGERRS